MGKIRLGALAKFLWTRTRFLTLTLVVSEGDATNTLTLTFYVNGDLVGNYGTANATNFIGETTNKVAFGYYANSTVADGGATTNIDNILVYSKTLTADEEKALIAPEPATSTLSLLALAGPASRRHSSDKLRLHSSASALYWAEVFFVLGGRWARGM